MKTISILLAILFVIGVVMFFTNPTQDNFENYLDKRSNSNIKKYSAGSRDRISGISEGENSSISSYTANMFERNDYYIFSIYKGKVSSAAKEAKYVGMFKFFFKSE